MGEILRAKAENFGTVIGLLREREQVVRLEVKRDRELVLGREIQLQLRTRRREALTERESGIRGGVGVRAENVETREGDNGREDPRKRLT